MTSTDSNSIGSSGTALIGACAVAGWCLHDLSVFASSGQPELSLVLVLASFQLMIGGALWGAAIGFLRRAFSGLAPLALCLLLFGVAAFMDFGLLEHRTWLLRSVACLGLVTLVCACLVERTQLGQVRGALGLGTIASVCLGAWQWHGRVGMSSLLVVICAILLLALGYWKAKSLRSLVSLAILVGLGAVLSNHARDRSQLTRAPQPEPTGAFEGPGRDLLLVILDTVRADRLAPYGYERATTPLLDGFVEQHAERFEWARSTSSWTLPSHASLFTGLMPSEHGASHPRGKREGGSVIGAEAQAWPLREDVGTLAEALAARGYRTAAVVSNFGYLNPKMGLDRGYQFYDSRSGGEVRGYVALAQMALLPVRAGRQTYRDATSVTDRGLAWLAKGKGDRPQFLTLNYMDAHTPYRPKAPFDGAFGGEVLEGVFSVAAMRQERETLSAGRSLLYDRSLRYLDSELDRLLRSIDLDNTVVIITADHGEALGAHGYWKHGWTLFDSITRVPLYLKPVGRALKPLRSEPISGAEIFALAMFELGLGEEAQRDPSRPMGELFQTLKVPKLDVLADKDVARDLISWMQDGRKWIVADTGAVSAFDVQGDPSELSPIELSHDQKARARLRAKLWWEANPPLDREVVPVTQEEANRLKDLGYMGDDEE